MQELRDSFIILNIGSKKTGKTTASVRMLLDFWERQQKPCIVLDLKGHPSYANFIALNLEQVKRFYARKHGLKPFYVFRPDPDPMAYEASIIEFCQIVAMYVRNTVVLFEDFTTYLEGNFHPAIKGMILDNRNACNDYIFNVHSFGDVGPFVLKHSELYVIRETADDPYDLPTKIPYTIRPLVQKCLLEINAENNRNVGKTLPNQQPKPRLASRMIVKDEARIIR